jgi:hypothetical protein
MLGDGSIQVSKTSKNKQILGEAKYCITMDAFSLNYLKFLYDNIYQQFGTLKIYPYPNINLPKHAGKVIKQYSFYTKSLPFFTCLHSKWYKWDKNKHKYIKIIPSNISKLFSEISLAYWIMDDGYFDSHGRTKTILLCTESFSKTECIFLQSLLSNLGIKTTLKIRDKENDRYRIRFSKTSISLVKELVMPYMHKDFLYKLGI